MSEIFDFLSKPEAGRRKEAQVASDTPAAESKKPPKIASSEDTETARPLPVDAEICDPNEIDLANASSQMKSVLDPLTLVGEQFRLLRAKLGLLKKQRGIKTVLITSSVPNEGKTFTASGLAGVFAQEPGKRVILIDSDMRKPGSGLNLGLNGSSSVGGLSEVLQGNRELQSELLMSRNPEFFFLPSGHLPPNPSELLSSNILERTLKAATESFDWVVIDSPPVMSLSDTTLISPLCDAVILVVRVNSTPSKIVLDTIDRIGKDRICGVVLNRQKSVRSSRYYYQYYYRSSKALKQ